MMNKESLMKGDWVKTDLGEIQQVVEIREDCVMLFYNDLYKYEDIEPIKITEDILKKNGFVEYKGFYRRVVYNDYDTWIIEIDSMIFEYGYGYLDLDHTNDDIGQGGIDHLKIKYVHELQHALSLCELNGSELKV